MMKMTLAAVGVISATASFAQATHSSSTNPTDAYRQAVEQPKGTNTPSYGQQPTSDTWQPNQGTNVNNYDRGTSQHDNSNQHKGTRKQ